MRGPLRMPLVTDMLGPPSVTATRLRASGPPDLRLVMINRAENVALVRQTLNGLGTALHLDEGLLDEMKTAVSEACNNVVLHAYEGTEGPLEVYVCPDRQSVTVVVRDQGTGIQPRPAAVEQGMQGVGLSLIQALTDRVEFNGGAGEGTEVRMTFSSERELSVEGVDGEEDRYADQVDGPTGEVVLSVCGLLIGPVLASVVAMLAARAGFTMERLADAQIVADTVAAHGVIGFTGRHIHLALDTTKEGRLLMRLAPLAPGGSERVVQASAVGGLDPLLERLPTELDVEPAGEAEEMRIALTGV